MASAKEALKSARQLLASEKYFDGVQLTNTALEAYENNLKAQIADLAGFQPMDMLRTPEQFLQKALPGMTEDQKAEVSDLFAVRAQILGGLGAGKRGLVDIAAALQLVPGNEAFTKIQASLDVLVNGAAAASGEGKTPCTIITGFLGAGKTTLLNHILHDMHGKRIAVIENEFGEVGIDDSLLNTNSALTEENVIEMNNGCICCTVRGDLIAGLKKIHKQAKTKNKPIDGVIIETTGLADPAPVAQTFFADDFVMANMQLDGILTVVDAKHVLEHLREEKPDGVVNEAVEQVAFADRLILNKTDLVSAEQLAEVKDAIRTVNKTAALKQTQNSRVDMDFIIGIKAFSLDKVLEDVSAGFLEEEVEEEGEEHGHSHGGGDHGHGDHGGHGGHGGHDGHDGHDGHGHAHDEGADGHGHGHDDAANGHIEGHGSNQRHGLDESSSKVAGTNGIHRSTTRKPKHQHDYRVSSVGITKEGEVAQSKLDKFIQWLMQSKGSDLYRSKGVLAVKGMSEKYVFQAVHMQFGGRPQDKWKEGEERCCKIVFIGKNLDREELNKKFDECFV